MSEHTGLPWHYTNQLIFQQDGICIAETFNRGFETPNLAANAEYIVRACNAHEDLLAACEKHIEAVDGIVSGIADRKARATRCIRAAIAQALCTPEPR